MRTHTSSAHLVLLLLLVAAGLSSAAPGQRPPLESALVSLAHKEFVKGEDRPRTDGTVDYALIAAELDLLASHVPRWNEAIKLHSEDPNHPHTVGEHQLRAFFNYAKSPYAKSIQGDPKRSFLCGLTVLLHDMGKVDSPRDNQGRQKKDMGHPTLCAAYVRKHGAALGLNSQEIEWMAMMLGHHRDLGQLERADREPAFATPDRVAQWRDALARTMKNRPNLDFLAALTEADVRGISGSAYDSWEVKVRLPKVTEEVGALIAKLKR